MYSTVSLLLLFSRCSQDVTTSLSLSLSVCVCVRRFISQRDTAQLRERERESGWERECVKVEKGYREIPGDMNIVYILIAGVMTLSLHAMKHAEARVETLNVEGDTRSQTVFLNLPSQYAEGEGAMPVPLVVLLHGLNGRGGAYARLYNLETVAEQKQLAYVAPDAVNRGERWSFGSRAWCASPICCCGGRTLTCNNRCRDDYELDSSFLREMIESILDRFNVDDSRVYVIGISNGAYMAYRLACDHGDLVAGILAICGGNVNGEELKKRCGAPVHVLHVHGDRDTVVPYGGLGSFLKTAPANVFNWATLVNRCSGTFRLDSDYLDERPTDHAWGRQLPGRISVMRYDDTTCQASAELHIVAGAGHCPGIEVLNINWLLDKKKRRQPNSD